MKKRLATLVVFFCVCLTTQITLAGSPNSKNHGSPLKSADLNTLTSFAFLKANNPGLANDIVVNTVSGSTVVTLPTGTNLTSLKATFTASGGAIVSVNGVAQTSGVSINDFSKPVVYQVSEINGSFISYTIEASVQVDIAAVEDAVKAFMTKYSIPGLSIAITKDERLIYAKGYGMADKDKGEPVTNNSLFRVASVSKSITARAALKLVDDGKLSLDQKVFGAGGILGTTYGTQPYPPQLEQITVRHLLSHTAGGDPWTSEWDYVNNKFDPFYQKEWLSYTNEQVLSAVLNTRPVTQTPGSKFVYSNIGINIVGRIIEKVTGIKYDKYVQDNLLKPIGIDPATMKMGGTTLAERFPNEVVYYNPYPGYDQPYDFPVPRMDAHSGWITTAINMARLLVYTDGYPLKKDILSANSLKEMYTPTTVSVNQLGGIGYGLGCYTYPTTTTSTHRGGMAGTTTVWWRFAGYTWVIFLNTRSSDGTSLSDLDLLMNPFLALPASSLMKGDQFDLYYGRPDSGTLGYCTPIQRDIYSCASSEGTIGLEAFKIWSAGKASVLLDSKGVCSQNGNAYSDLTGLPTIKLKAGASFPFQAQAMLIQSGASKGKIYLNPVSIWIDLDQNKVFTDDERVYYTTSTQSYPSPLLESQFTIPATAKIGQTRMRIRLGTSFSGAPETPCEQIDGETEDYLVDISASCPLTASIAGNTSICQGSSTILTASATSGQGTLTYSWKVDNAATGTNSNTLTANASGQYTVTVTDGNGCSASASLNLTASAPKPSLTGDILFCDGTATVLKASATGGIGTYGFNWKRDGVSVGQTSSITLTQGGNFTLEATDQAGCLGVTSFTATTKPSPTANAGLGGTLTGTELYKTESFTTATGGKAPYTYLWKTTPTTVTGNNAITANPTFGPFTTTTTISLLVSDQTGCSSTTATTITYQPCSLTVGLSGIPMLCGGSTTKLTATATNGNGTLTYEWKRASTVIGTAIDQTITATDTYTLRITDAKGCSASTSFSVGAGSLPDALITAGNLDLLPNGTVSLSANTGAGLTYQWNLAGSAIAGATASSYPAQKPGVYTVSVSKDGCVSTSPAVTVNLITANEPVTSGIRLAIYPNPSSGQTTVTLTLDKPAQATLNLIDATGRSLRQWELTTPRTKHEIGVDFGLLPAGVYLLNADVDGQQIVRKVVKE